MRMDCTLNITSKSPKRNLGEATIYKTEAKQVKDGN